MYNDVVGPCTTLLATSYMSGLVTEFGTVQEIERIFGWKEHCIEGFVMELSTRTWLATYINCHPLGLEFLTHETTCASEMLEKTTCEIFCQKRPPMSGGTPGQATRDTCRRCHCRQAPAAVAIAGT
jgi:hypothetical protein